MSFHVDNTFSKHKDLLWKFLWEQNSFEGRYVIPGSKLLQKTHGIDIILQGNNDKTEYKIDTKHVRGHYDSVYLEEYSCTIPGRESLGWVLKEYGHPDYIFYFMHHLCKKCYKNCFFCDKFSEEEIISNAKIFFCRFSLLRRWFKRNKDNFPYHVNEKQINKTSGRTVPIEKLMEEINLKELDLKEIKRQPSEKEKEIHTNVVEEKKYFRIKKGEVQGSLLDIIEQGEQRACIA